MDNPGSYLIIVALAITVGTLWLRRPAPFRAVAQRGGWWLAIAVLSSLSMLVFASGVALGQLVVWIPALIVGAPLTWSLLISFARNRPQPPK